MGAVTDLYVHVPPLWLSLDMGGRMVLCVLVCVTLNLSLQIFVIHPSPLDLYPGGLSLGGSMKVGVFVHRANTSLGFSESSYTGPERNASLHLPIP